MSAPITGPVILELGSYVAPAHAGRMLAEQGYRVEKWTRAGADPILGLRDGKRLWDWYIAGKYVADVPAAHVAQLEPGLVDGIIDNHTEHAWARWGIDPTEQARRLGIPWVSIVADTWDPQGGLRSFDAFAQARAFGPDCPPIPFYIGDTAAGLSAAFVLTAAMAQRKTGRLLVFQAAALAKLREGDLAVRPPAGADGEPGGWDEPGSYEVHAGGATVTFRGQTYDEPARDDEWRKANLPNVDGQLMMGVSADTMHARQGSDQG